MSINDLLDADLTMPIMVVVVVICILGLIGIPVLIKASKKTEKNIYGSDEYGIAIVEKNARILARRSGPHPLNQALVVNTVVFELANGSRIELAIKDNNVYGTMLEGDCGTLKYNGKKFLAFERYSTNRA